MATLPLTFSSQDQFFCGNGVLRTVFVFSLNPKVYKRMPLKLYIWHAGVAYRGTEILVFATEISVTGITIFPPYEHSRSGAWDETLLIKKLRYRNIAAKMAFFCRVCISISSKRTAN